VAAVVEANQRFVSGKSAADVRASAKQGNLTTESN